MNASILSRRWGINVRHALYRATGNWYHQLRHFPAAFFDSNGYIIFETEEGYRSCKQLQIKKDVNIPDTISKIPGYVQVIVDGIEQPTQPLRDQTYEQAVSKISEGRAIEVTMTRFERDPKARKECLDHHGLRCAVCTMSFEEKYGTIGAGFMHVHHLNPLSESKGPIEVDPIKDLCPVCPNCHAMIHKTNPILTIEALRNMLR